MKLNGNTGTIVSSIPISNYSNGAAFNTADLGEANLWVNNFAQKIEQAIHKSGLSLDDVSITTNASLVPHRSYHGAATGYGHWVYWNTSAASVVVSIKNPDLTLQKTIFTVKNMNCEQASIAVRKLVPMLLAVDACDGDFSLLTLTVINVIR